MRLIDANALGIGKAKREAFENPAYADGWNSAIEIIENAPTVDAVEVVRCKDCKMFVENREAVTTYCRRCLRDVYARPDDFCSYGERKVVTK